MNEPPNDESPDTLETIKEQAHKLIDLERWNEAISLLSQALAVAPHDAEAISNLSIAHLEIGDLKTAVALSAQAVIAEPTNASAHAIRSRILIKNGPPDLAYKSALDAVRLDSQSIDSLDALFWSQLSLNRRFEARNTAYKMLELAPDLALSHKNLAHSAIRFGQWKDAERHCRAALKLDPLAYDAMNNLGLALENQRASSRSDRVLSGGGKTRSLQEKPRANLGTAAIGYVNGPPVAANALARLLKSSGLRCCWSLPS
jgi:tetratricopeptide (TPR) repeat protein